MQFSNPGSLPSTFTVTGGTVDTVNNNVPTPGRDLFYWPAISGESFPPSLSGTSYQFSQGLPAYSFPSTATNVSFAQIPRYIHAFAGGVDKRAVTIRFRMWISNTAVNAITIFQWGADVGAGGQNGSGVALSLDATGKLFLSSGTQGSRQIIQAAAAVNRAVWIDVQIDLDASGNVTLTLDGVVIATITSGARWNYNDATNLGIAAIFKNPSTAASAQSYFSQLQFTWS